MADRAHLERFTKELIDKGKLIEAGWISMRLACGLENAPPDQLHQMRMAFFGGAQHLLGSMMSALDPDAEATEEDLRRMGLIAGELDTFIVEFAREHIHSQGGMQ